MSTARFRVPHPVRRVLLGAAAAGLLAALAGCGFHPLDARGTNAEALPELARIHVGLIPDRTGQIMRGELSRRLNPTSADLPPAYALQVRYTANSVSRGTRLDDSAIRIDITITADFTLTTWSKEDTPSRILLAGTSLAVARKNNTDALYATYVSEEEATARAARLAAEDIARQVALYFKYPDRYPEVLPPVKPAPALPQGRPARP
ncbi:LPS assembly lipoprotein LptE [Oleispirillum naphthae]|uniref:LPS assembly lipoprotein LptE n=1 Tax=Oleispirillum naphthae TaxID=2838853 RepID=UPI003082453E